MRNTTYRLHHALFNWSNMIIHFRKSTTEFFITYQHSLEHKNNDAIDSVEIGSLHKLHVITLFANTC